MKTLLLLLLLVLIPVAVFAKKSDGLPDRKETTMIVVHHSATTTGSVEIFRRYHVENNGWKDIGYHYVILPNGTIQAGRRETAVGAHAKERHRNFCSVGICLVGEDNFPPAQKEALAGLIARLCAKYYIVPSHTSIQPHHEQCPGLGLDLPAIIKQVQIDQKR